MYDFLVLHHIQDDTAYGAEAKYIISLHYMISAEMLWSVGVLTYK